MSEERGTNCSLCGRAHAASVHVRGSGEFTHEWKRTAKPRKRVSAMGRSERGIADAEQWALDKEIYLAEHPTCELVSILGEDCSDPPYDVHHVTPRSMGGTVDDDSELVTACRHHHNLVEKRRAWSKLHGLLKQRHLPGALGAAVLR